MKQLLCLLSVVWLVGCAHQSQRRAAPPPTLPSQPSASITPPSQPITEAPKQPMSPGPADEETWALRRQIVSIAQSGLGKRWIRCGAGMRLRRDCSGWVRCVYSHMRLDVMRPPDPHDANGVLLTKRFVDAFGTFHKAQLPALGDLVFWHYTYDKNRNGLLDDLWTHIGIVEEIDTNGRIAVLHYDGKVKRVYMHLSKPSVHIDPLLAQSEIPDNPNCQAQRTRYAACQKRYGSQGCRWSHHRMKQACAPPQAIERATANSYLVDPRKAGIIYGKHTGELFAGFGTILQTPLPSHLRINRHAISSVYPTPSHPQRWVSFSTPLSR
ncbi:C40 family peptidase [Myxococcota bacterium]|nr:C40 family peptidase [Myxococcota bacterium]